MKVAIKDSVKASQFNILFHYLKSTTDTYTFTFDSTGLLLRGMDPSHVCLFQIILKNDWFSEYTVNDTHILSLSSNSFDKVLQAYDSQNIIMSHSEGSNSLDVKFEVDKSKMDKNMVFAKSFTLSLLSVDSLDLNIPEFEYCAEIEMPSKILSQLIDQMSNFTDTVKVACSEEEIIFDATGDETSMKVNIELDQLTEYQINEGETVDVCFSVSFLRKICTLQRLTEKVELGISDSYPLMVTYDLGNESSLKFYLAPKIDDV